jgi:hypothetical protein
MWRAWRMKRGAHYRCKSPAMLAGKARMLRRESLKQT